MAPFMPRIFSRTPSQESSVPPPPPRQEDDLNYTENILGVPYGNVEAKYLVGKRLGSGKNGEVFSVSDRETSEAFACKVLLKSRMSRSDVVACSLEVQILAAVIGHPAIVAFREAIEDEQAIYIIMELCHGGDLFDRIEKRKTFPEADAAQVCRILLSALQFIHERGIIHGDIKPENVMMAQPYSDLSVRVADFGEAVFCIPGEKVTHVAGTASYVAPEVLDRSYGHEADIWSLGVVMYVMLSGEQPFRAKEVKSIFEQVMVGKYDLEAGPWTMISPAAKDLVRRMMCLNPQARITAEQAKRHPWILHHWGQGQLQGLTSSGRRAPPPLTVAIPSASKQLRAGSPSRSSSYGGPTTPSPRTELQQPPTPPTYAHTPTAGSPHEKYRSSSEDEHSPSVKAKNRALRLPIYKTAIGSNPALYASLESPNARPLSDENEPSLTKSERVQKELVKDLRGARKGTGSVNPASRALQMRSASVGGSVSERSDSPGRPKGSPKVILPFEGGGGGKGGRGGGEGAEGDFTQKRTSSLPGMPYSVYQQQKQQNQQQQRLPGRPREDGEQRVLSKDLEQQNGHQKLHNQQQQKQQQSGTGFGAQYHERRDDDPDEGIDAAHAPGQHPPYPPNDLRHRRTQSTGAAAAILFPTAPSRGSPDYPPTFRTSSPSKSPFRSRTPDRPPPARNPSPARTDIVRRVGQSPARSSREEKDANGSFLPPNSGLQQKSPLGNAPDSTEWALYSNSLSPSLGPSRPPPVDDFRLDESLANESARQPADGQSREEATYVHRSNGCESLLANRGPAHPSHVSSHQAEAPTLPAVAPASLSGSFSMKKTPSRWPSEGPTTNTVSPETSNETTSDLFYSEGEQQEQQIWPRQDGDGEGPVLSYQESLLTHFDRSDEALRHFSPVSTAQANRDLPPPLTLSQMESERSSIKNTELVPSSGPIRKGQIETQSYDDAARSNESELCDRSNIENESLSQRHRRSKSTASHRQPAALEDDATSVVSPYQAHAANYSEAQQMAKGGHRLPGHFRSRSTSEGDDDVLFKIPGHLVIPDEMSALRSPYRGDETRSSRTPGRSDASGLTRTPGRPNTPEVRGSRTPGRGDETGRSRTPKNHASDSHLQTPPRVRTPSRRSNEIKSAHDEQAQADNGISQVSGRLGHDDESQKLSTPVRALDDLFSSRSRGKAEVLSPSQVPNGWRSDTSSRISGSAKEERRRVRTPGGEGREKSSLQSPSRASPARASPTRASPARRDSLQDGSSENSAKPRTPGMKLPQSSSTKQPSPDRFSSGAQSQPPSRRTNSFDAQILRQEEDDRQAQLEATPPQKTPKSRLPDSVRRSLDDDGAVLMAMPTNLVVTPGKPGSTMGRKSEVERDVVTYDIQVSSEANVGNDRENNGNKGSGDSNPHPALSLSATTPLPQRIVRGLPEAQPLPSNTRGPLSNHAVNPIANSNPNSTLNTSSIVVQPRLSSSETQPGVTSDPEGPSFSVPAPVPLSTFRERLTPMVLSSAASEVAVAIPIAHTRQHSPRNKRPPALSLSSVVSCTAPRALHSPLSTPPRPPHPASRTSSQKSDDGQGGNKKHPRENLKKPSPREQALSDDPYLPRRTRSATSQLRASNQPPVDSARSEDTDEPPSPPTGSISCWVSPMMLVSRRAPELVPSSMKLGEDDSLTKKGERGDASGKPGMNLPRHGSGNWNFMNKGGTLLGRMGSRRASKLNDEETGTSNSSVVVGEQGDMYAT
eukprot:TRINITY_DN2207_c1_g1_i1.p1 TRINITY_DN2207_c1_g1~~TRINITY_DN2207_c1_g1_i1.p1  ORF type:complete len:1730 (+),score=245.25 TRINITY_DN2207_c1_g1_i1:218-5407(+)